MVIGIRMKKTVLGSILLVAGFLILAQAFPADAKEPRAVPISYSEFKSLIIKRAILKVSFAESRAEGVLHKPMALGDRATESARFSVQLPEIGIPSLLTMLDEANIAYEFSAEPEESIGDRLYWILPWLLIIGAYFWISRRMYQNASGGLGGKTGVGQFLEGTSRDTETSEAPTVTFDDVAGQDNAKREVSELLDFLGDPDKFTRLGAEVPHGILLMGPPGTGKTLLARALAGEANVPFFSISASEFIEVFVGVGASRVRHMFDEAKQRAPSIIFIDELDAIGRMRGTGFGGGHDEREQTLNQILSEMDGFGGHEAVIVLAATNRPDVLDPALLRPGRFDRHVTLTLPDRPAREQILKVHVREVPLADDVDLAEIAAGTPGFSGADLKNLVNEAAMLGARQDALEVTQTHFNDARDKVIMGPVRSLLMTEDERHRLAVHEAGHTVTAHYLTHADPLYKVTIIPRGRALGMTQQLPEDERYTLPKEYLRDRLAVLLGGRAAESVVLDDSSSGADDDIHQATALARAMISRWGMSETVGPVDVRDSDEHPFLGREMAQPRHFSDATAHLVDEAVRDLLIEAQSRAGEMIDKHRPRLDNLVAALEDKETLDRDEIDAILGLPSTPPHSNENQAPDQAENS